MKRHPAKPGVPELAHVRILYGWHEIAAYLRRAEVTVRRWHAQRPLPIARLGGVAVSPTAAIDLWVLEAPAIATPGRKAAA